MFKQINRFADYSCCANRFVVATAVVDAEEVFVASSPFVLSLNAAVSPNNKINLYNASTGVCVTGVVPAGPATTLWPAAMVYNLELSKLFVLYYPFTGSITNAQVWSFTVTATNISSGVLVYNDVGGDIATTSATPAALAGDITYGTLDGAGFLLVGTSANSVIRLNYDSLLGTATKEAGPPLIYNSIYSQTVSSVLVVPN